jgi:hypothetical protein
MANFLIRRTAMELLSLGKISVAFGQKGDQNRVKAMVGAFPGTINLAPAKQWFPRVNEWPEGTDKMALAIAWFPGEVISGYDAVLTRLAEEGIGEDRLTVLPHLAAAVLPRCDELWQKCQAGECPRWIHTSHPSSLWLYAYGRLFVPFVRLFPPCRKLDGYWVRNDFSDNDGFLVVCES